MGEGNCECSVNLVALWSVYFRITYDSFSLLEYFRTINCCVALFNRHTALLVLLERKNRFFPTSDLVLLPLSGRYGSAELCWQYVTLLGNAVLCLAERYSSSTSATPLFKVHPPLEQMSRLGCLLSRFLVFLTARQQVGNTLPSWNIATANVCSNLLTCSS